MPRLFYRRGIFNKFRRWSSNQDWVIAITLFFFINYFMKNKNKLLKNKIATKQSDPEKDIQQFQIEIQTWKQLLNAGMEENILLKNRISDILKNNYDHSSLEEIEEFQTRFISEDELIHSLKNDVNDSGNLLYRKLSENERMEKPFYKKMENLRRDITDFTNRFHILKLSFNDFQHKISVKRKS